MQEQRTYLNKAQHPVGTRLLYRDLGSKGEPREVLITEWSVTGYAWRGLFTNEYSLSMCEEIHPPTESSPLFHRALVTMASLLTGPVEMKNFSVMRTTSNSQGTSRSEVNQCSSP